MDSSERGQEDIKAEIVRLREGNVRLREENIRLHEETRAEIRREIRFVLQAMREHTHADGSPAIVPVPVDIDGD